jgi:hypothetical protein
MLELTGAEPVTVLSNAIVLAQGAAGGLEDGPDK